MDAIRLDRVLLVVNSDNAQSVADAADYATKRSLTGGHTIAFAFGTLGGSNNFTLAQLLTSGGPACTTAPYAGQMFLPALAHYMADHDIDAVILSTFTPCGFNPQSSGKTYTLASVAGYAKQMFRFGSIPVSYFDEVNYVAVPHDTVANIQANVCQNWHPFSSRNVAGALPHGMLGCPNFSTSTIAERPLRVSVGVESIYTHAVTKGLIAEALDHTPDLHLVTDNIDVTRAAQAAFWARQLAIANLRNAGNGVTYDPTGGGSWSGAMNVFAGCGSFGSFVQSWAFGGTFADSFTVQPGGWYYQFVSNTGFLGTDFLYNGGSAAVFTFGEPLSDGIPNPQELFIYATTYKMPLMQAHFLAHSNGMGSTVVGDPLYTPYLSTDVVPPKAWRAPHS